MRIFFLAILVKISIMCFGQENFIPGYIIDNNGNRVDGLLDYREWRTNPEKIIFKVSTANEPEEYGPSDIEEFGVEQDVYISATVDTEMSPWRLNRLGTESAFQLERIDAFLQVLVKGEKSLYYHKNSIGKDNFYIRRDDGLELLAQKKYNREHNGNLLAVENAKFRGQLKVYLNECERIGNSNSKLAYDRKSLLNLFVDYYDCTGNQTTFKQTTERLVPKFGVIVGISSTSLSISGATGSPLYDMDMSTSLDPVFGLQLDLILPRNNGSWSIYNEVLHTSYKIKGSVEYQGLLYRSRLEYSYIQINNMIRYRMQKEKLNILFSAGMSNGFSYNETNLLNEFQRFIDYRTHEQGLIFGTGLEMNKSRVEIRYQTGNGISNITNVGTKTQRIFLLVGYTF